jgi:LysR family transcriptional regulator (chromosome initiation inhibitor)
MMNLPPERLEALVAAVSEGTFEAAARKLHVTPSAVSQRVKALEQAVGRVLLTRSKPVAPTSSGEAVLRVARQIQMLTSDIARELGSEPADTAEIVALAVNADSLATWLLPALATVGRGVVFDLRRDDQDRTADLLRQGSAMAAVTTLAHPVAGCTVARLGRMRYLPAASAAFVAAWFPEGMTLEALGRAPMVTFDRDDRLGDAYLHRRTRKYLDPPRQYVPGSGAFFDAVRLGLGWGMIPELQIADRARAEDLVDLTPDEHVDITLYWQQWRLPSAALNRVAQAVRMAAGAMLR